MSVSKWAYEPEKCNGKPCVGECDICSKVEIIEELKNELCLQCGKYELAHVGACNGCKWENIES